MFPLVILGVIGFNNGKGKRTRNPCSGHWAGRLKLLRESACSLFLAYQHDQGPTKIFKWHYWRVREHGTRHSGERLEGYKAIKSKEGDRNMCSAKMIQIYENEVLIIFQVLSIPLLLDYCFSCISFGLILTKLNYCIISNFFESFNRSAATVLSVLCSQLDAKTSLKFVDYEGMLELNSSYNSSGWVLLKSFTSEACKLWIYHIWALSGKMLEVFGLL